MPRVSLLTLCGRLKEAETRAMGEALETIGFDAAPFGHPAELTLIHYIPVTVPAHEKLAYQQKRRKVLAAKGKTLRGALA